MKSNNFIIPNIYNIHPVALVPHIHSVCLYDCEKYFGIQKTGGDIDHFLIVKYNLPLGKKTD